MRTTLLIPVMLATALSACGKSEAPKAPAPTEPAAAAPAPVAPAVVEGAAKFTAACASCHGANGQGQGTFPKLAGLTSDVVKGKLADYKAGKQVGAQTAMMAPIASQLSDAEVEALAGHIATLK
jgi:cytochrome c553